MKPTTTNPVGNPARSRSSRGIASLLAVPLVALALSLGSCGQQQGQQQEPTQREPTQQSDQRGQQREPTRLSDQQYEQRAREQQGDTAGPEQGNADARVSAIARDPQRFYERDVMTVSGEVARVIEPQAFVMVDPQAAPRGGSTDGERPDDRGVLVISTGGSDPELSEGQAVEVAGALRPFDIAEFERQQDVDLDDELYREHEGKPLLMSVQVRRR